MFRVWTPLDRDFYTDIDFLPMKAVNDIEDMLADQRNGAPAPFLQFLGNQ